MSEYPEIENYKLIESETLDEISSEVVVYEHTLLKTNITFIQNKDVNKCFCVGFDTPPVDSTGVPHIIEHSVLSGSKRYPIKDVFSELVKGSLTTFLNAMTYSDKTIYPFSTRNDKEFFNLMNVYLDLTLNPMLDEDTFMQEGWHYSIKDKKEALTLNGIVLNEMKGVFSDPVRKMWEFITRYLFPDSTYANSSGGDPEDIPNLTYQDFLNFHKNHYHPSNSKLVLYGDIDIAKTLNTLQADFFKEFSYQKPGSKIELGNVIQSPVHLAKPYPVSEMEGSQNYFSMGIYTGMADSVEHNMSMELLTNILINSEASPLKIELIKAGVGSEVGCFYNETMLSFLFIYVIGASENCLEIMKEKYLEVLGKIVKDGFNKDLILSEINSYEFDKREHNVSAKRGMDVTIDSISSMMYGIDVASTLETNAIIAKIKKMALEERYFEKIIEEVLINNNSIVYYQMLPDAELSEKDRVEEESKFTKLKENLTDEALEKILEKTRLLEQKQIEPNPEDKVRLLPKLKLSDVKPKVESLSFIEKLQNKRKIWITDNETNGIHYLNIGFDTSSLESKYLPFLTLFGQILTEIGTKSLNYIELAKEINTYTGGFGCWFDNYSTSEEPSTYKPYLWFHIKFFDEYTEKVTELINDVFFNVDFSNTERLKEIVDRTNSALKYNVSSDGYFIPVSRVSAYLSKKGAYNELVQGYSSVKAIDELAGATQENPVESMENLLGILNDIYESLIQKNNSVFHITSEPEKRDKIEKFTNSFIEKLPNGQTGSSKIEFPVFNKNEAFVNSADVVYAVLGGNLFDAGLQYCGQLEVLRKWLDRDYLYNKIRVQSGAYGNFSKLNQFTGDLILTSYRDPNVLSTFEAYKSIPNALSNLTISDYALDQLKISTYSAFDPLMSASQKGSKARNDYMHGITPDDIKKWIDQILSTSSNDLRDMAQGFSVYLEKSVISIIGNKEKILKQKNLFSGTISL